MIRHFKMRRDQT